MAAPKQPRVVAELGRPETPQETADRKAATSRKHRQNQTTLNLVVATIASLAIVLFLVLVVVRPDNQAPRQVDYVVAAEDARATAGAELVAPALPDGWYANDARFGLESGVPTWYIGFISPSDGFIAVNQGIDANASWQAAMVRDASVTSTTDIGGIEWDVYDRRDANDTGNYAFALAATVDDTFFVLHGTADDADFETVAASIAAELGE